MPDTSNGFVSLAASNSERPYWFVYLTDSRTLYFKYNQCVNPVDQPFSGFVTQLFAVFDTNRPDRLVVDLRNNPGGNAAVLNPFLSGLQARLTTSPETRVYVLINRGTFSSAMVNARQLKDARAGVLMGEPTGGNPTAPWYNTSGFGLPNSRLTVMHTVNFAATNYQAGGAVTPDLVVPVNSYDAFARHDPVLAAALADSQGDPPQDDSPIIVVNSATLRAGSPVAPGSLASAFGAFSSISSGNAATLPLPTQIGATRLLVNDVAAPLLAVSPDQVTFQVPAATPEGKVTVRVVQDGNTIAAGTMYVAAAGPGIFSTAVLAPGRPGAILNGDYGVNAEANPARAGEFIRFTRPARAPQSPPSSRGCSSGTPRRKSCTAACTRFIPGCGN